MTLSVLKAPSASPKAEQNVFYVERLLTGLIALAFIILAPRLTGALANSIDPIISAVPLGLVAIAGVRLLAPIWLGRMGAEDLREEYVDSGYFASLSALGGFAWLTAWPWAVAVCGLALMAAGLTRRRPARLTGLPHAERLLKDLGVKFDDLLGRADFHQDNLRIWPGRAADTPAILANHRGQEWLILPQSSLDMYSPRHLRMILAHELGHVANDDIKRIGHIRLSLRAVQALVLALSLRLNPLDLGSAQSIMTGAFAFIIVETACVPVLNFLLRRRERLANEWAMRTTRDPDALFAAYQELNERSGFGKTQSLWQRFWFGANPTLNEVARQVQEFQRRNAELE